MVLIDFIILLVVCFFFLSKCLKTSSFFSPRTKVVSIRPTAEGRSLQVLVRAIMPIPKWWWCGRCVCSKTFTSLPDSSIFGTITEKKTKWLSLRSVLALRLLVTPSVLHTTLITQWPIEPRPNNYRTPSYLLNIPTWFHVPPRFTRPDVQPPSSSTARVIQFLCSRNFKL